VRHNLRYYLQQIFSTYSSMRIKIAIEAQMDVDL